MAGPGRYLIGEEEKQALLEVIESGHLFRYGDQKDQQFKAMVWHFEQEVSKMLGIPYTVAVNSGTSALLVALGSVGVGPGDEVIVPGYTFIASITSIINARAIPILAEIDESFTLDPKDVEKKISSRTKAIILVHMLGNPGYIKEIKDIANRHNLYLIEDCAQAFGAQYKGKYVGSYGDIGTYSFNLYKTINAGDGGMIVTANKEFFKRAFAIHDQGHLPLRQGVEQGSRTVIGHSFRMTELQAAVLRVQLKKMSQIKTLLRENKRKFKEKLHDTQGLEYRKIPDPEGEICTLLTVLFPNERTARKVGEELNCGVLADSGWHVYNNMEHVLAKKVVDDIGCPFTCPYYTNKGGAVEYSKGMLPITDSILNRAINISIGVSDAGLGAGFGITINSSEEEINKKADRFIRVTKKYL